MNCESEANLTSGFLNVNGTLLVIMGLNIKNLWITTPLNNEWTKPDYKREGYLTTVYRGDSVNSISDRALIQQ